MRGNDTKTVEQMVKHYREMRQHVVEHSSFATASMLEEIKRQYIDMAQGGDGGELFGFESRGKTCRSYNYPGYPDTFFLRVCEGMGWL